MIIWSSSYDHHYTSKWRTRKIFVGYRESKRNQLWPGSRNPDQGLADCPPVLAEGRSWKHLGQLLRPHRCPCEEFFLLKVFLSFSHLANIFSSDTFRRVQAVWAGQGTRTRGSEGVPWVQDCHHRPRPQDLLEKDCQFENRTVQKQAGV